ncbi:MAG: SMC-Scp complex subunit ScpB [Acidobacteriota bacterium]
MSRLAAADARAQDLQELQAVLEAVLFVSNEPVSRDRLLEIFGPSRRDDAERALAAVVARWRQAPTRGFMIDEVAGGLRLVTRPDLHAWLRRFFEVSGSNKLSMPALETLAIVAYRQPITAPEIQELRGVASSGVLKTLLERRLVRIAGRKEVVGKPFLYATTRDFLMHFGLRSLKELPPLEQFEELFAGDLEASVDEAPDRDEEVARQAAEIDAAEDATAEAAAREAIELERQEAEAAEAMHPAEEPATASGLEPASEALPSASEPEIDPARGDEGTEGDSMAQSSDAVVDSPPADETSHTAQAPSKDSAPEAPSP